MRTQNTQDTKKKYVDFVCPSPKELTGWLGRQGIYTYIPIFLMLKGKFKCLLLHKASLIPQLEEIFSLNFFCNVA